jgi:hypothetical protein
MRMPLSAGLVGIDLQAVQACVLNGPIWHQLQWPQLEFGAVVDCGRVAHVLPCEYGVAAGSC